MSERYCEHCYNTGELNCYCGGDLCVCYNNGTYPCPFCDDAPDDDDDFFCDEIEEPASS